jgi:hypothetical protein
VKTNKKKSQSQEDVKIGKAKTLSQLSEELRANKKKILSKPSDDSKTGQQTFPLGVTFRTLIFFQDFGIDTFTPIK